MTSKTMLMVDDPIEFPKEGSFECAICNKELPWKDGEKPPVYSWTWDMVVPTMRVLCSELCDAKWRLGSGTKEE